MNSIISSALNEGRFVLNVEESKQILIENDFPVSKSVFVTDKKQITDYCTNLSFPLVMKIVSPDIIHKTDVGGVVLNLSSLDEVIKKYEFLLDSITSKFPNYTIKGVILEEQVQNGIELIGGVVNDATFGHCLMFGLGGIFVEVLKDTSFRLIPCTKSDIESMISEIKFSKILEGVRGKSVNNSKLINVLFKLSSLIDEHANLFSEVDLNPIIAYGENIIITDARIILKH
jgi:hypothetical protein